MIYKSQAMAYDVSRLHKKRLTIDNFGDNSPIHDVSARRYAFGIPLADTQAQEHKDVLF